MTSPYRTERPLSDWHIPGDEKKYCSGCRIEEIWFDGAELHIHYEDGRADAYLDMDPDSYEPMEFSAEAPTVFAGRLAVLKWARETTARMTMQ